ncbi:MAG TPA: helicase-related protein [Vicinamibacterales bacterium]|nr:helicase-related protein [Vicinamibacterales bacterium]
MRGALPLPGDTVWIRRRRWRVDRASRDRELVRLDVSWRRKRRTFLEPFDRVTPGCTAGEVRVRRQQAWARLAGSLARTREFRLPLCLLDADVDILPHQLEPVLAVIAGHARLLIADEVGLGKTVQAGLVVAELVRRIATPRVLIVVPASLRDQWQTELVRRFDIDCLMAGRRQLDTLSLDGAFGASPWQRSGVWLVSTDFIKQPAVLRSLPRDPWDLIVMDEAHGICGDSDRYDACHGLAQRSRRVLLLTATPHSGEDARFTRLISLGALGGAADRPLVFRRTRHELGLARTRHVRWHFVRLADLESATLEAIDGFEREATTASAPPEIEAARLLVSVLRKRALSTFASLSISLSRRLRWLGDEDSGREHWTQPRLLFDDIDVDEDGAADRAALTAEIGLDAHRERWWLHQLKDLADSAAQVESKIERLKALLSRTSEPVIVFTEFRDSLDAIVRHLQQDRTIAVIHGGQARREQQAELKRYLSGPASVLIATDVAGQGLNLQSRGRWVISLELPWNPARLEQRLGRVDRIGQRRIPHLTMLVARHTAESGLLGHLTRRVNSAQRSFARDLLSAVVPPGLPPREGPAATPATALCRRWRRAAFVVARALAQRRNLAAQWQGPIEDPGRTIRAGRHGRRGFVIGSVSVVDRLDEFVERCRFALIAPPDFCALSPKVIASHARRILEQRLRRRLHRLVREVRRTSRRHLERERLILAALRVERASFESQVTLFDASAALDHQHHVTDHERIAAAMRDRAVRFDAASDLRAGEIEVDFVIVGGIETERAR